MDAAHADRSVFVPLHGRRHELGVRPRRLTLLAVRRVQRETTIEFTLGLDELGSWQSGWPVAVEIGLWSTDDTEEPAHAVRVSVTDENGTTPWQQ